MDNFIYDRNTSDVARVEALRIKVRNRTATAEENIEWLSSLKGAYNETDLNRIGRIMNELSNLLNQYGYYNSVSAKQNWQVGDKPNPSDMENFINNLSSLKNSFNYIPESPQVPLDMVSLTYEEANNIEKILYEIDRVIKELKLNLIYSGVANMGQIRIWQQRFRRAKVWSSLVETFNKYSTYTVANIGVPSSEYNGAKTNLGLCLLDSQYGVGESIYGINESFEILDGLVGDVNE